MAPGRNDLLKRLEELKIHLGIGSESNACWCIEKILQPLIDEITLPVGMIKGGKLCCPKGHASEFSWVEDTTLTRQPDTFEPGADGKGGTLVVNGYYRTDDEGGVSYLFCEHFEVVQGKPAPCGTAFSLPLHVDVEWI